MQESTEEIPRVRPLSPHLTIYKLQISSVLSIGHRFSGVGLFVMMSLLCWWFVFWVFDDFDKFYLELFHNAFVKLLLILTSYAFFYHLCTGIRHLIWDIGYGFSIETMNYSGWMVVIVSLLLTIIFWVCI